MILVVDYRRPPSLGVDIALQLEAFLENSQKLVSQCCVLGRTGAVEPPSALIVPTSSEGKAVQVVCRGRPVTPADVSRTKLVDIEEDVYGDSFGWKFLLDATLTATRIRGKASEKIVVLTTNLMLTGEGMERDAERFFSETSRALGVQNPRCSISLVFVEVSGSCISSSSLSASDSFAAWDKLQLLRGGTTDGVYVLDLIENNPAMFDSQLRCWLRDSSLRQACVLKLPATETFSGVTIEVEITPYLLDESSLRKHGSQPALHKGFTNMEVVQGVWLGTLDQGLCRGNPLLCTPSNFQGSPQQSQANRKLFTAVCAELNGQDMGLLLSIRHPSISLQERWLLLPQAPPSESSTPIITEKTFSRGGDSGQILVGRALMIRLAMKEDVLEEGSTSTLDNMEVAECSVERAAACASLEVLKKGTYNPLRHSSGLFECLASLEHVQHANGEPAAIAAPSGRASLGRVSQPQEAAKRFTESFVSGKQQQQQQQKLSLFSRPVSIQSASLSSNRSSARGTSVGGKNARSQQLPKKREISLRHAEPFRNGSSPQQGRSAHGSGWGGGNSTTKGRSSRRHSTPYHGVGKEDGKDKRGKGSGQCSGRKGRGGDDEEMML